MNVKNIMIKLRNNLRSKYKNYDDNEECILRLTGGYLYCNDADNMLTYTKDKTSDDVPVIYFNDDTRGYGIFTRETGDEEINRYIGIIENHMKENQYTELYVLQDGKMVKK